MLMGLVPVVGSISASSGVTSWQGPGEENCLEVTLHAESIMTNTHFALLIIVSLTAMQSAANIANSTNSEIPFHLAGHCSS